MLSDFLGGFLFGLAINLKRLRLHNKRASFPACLRNNENLTGDCVSIVTPSFFMKKPSMFPKIFSRWLVQLSTLPIRWLRRFIWSLSEVFIAHTFLYSRLVSLVWSEIPFFSPRRRQIYCIPSKSNSSPGSPLQKDAWKTKLLPLLHGSLLQKGWTLVNLGEKRVNSLPLVESQHVKKLDSVGTSNVSLVHRT